MRGFRRVWCWSAKVQSRLKSLDSKLQSHPELQPCRLARTAILGTCLILPAACATNSSISFLPKLSAQEEPIEWMPVSPVEELPNPEERVFPTDAAVPPDQPEQPVAACQIEGNFMPDLAVVPVMPATSGTPVAPSRSVASSPSAVTTQPAGSTQPPAPSPPASPAASVAVVESPGHPLAKTGLAVIESWGAMIAARTAAAPFPEIHGMARLARVPVIMYHDILAEKQVFFDVTPEEFEADLQLIQQKGLTPISLDQLLEHLSTGLPLPEKPILLTFDDGYEGHYTYVYPLLKKYGYPGAFGIYTAKVGQKMGRSSLNWEQIREMAADPLITIASHSISHPRDLGALSEQEMRHEIVESKRILETELGKPINHFVYPEGNYNEQVQAWAQMAGYKTALTMNDAEDRFAGASKNLLAIDRIGQGSLELVIDQAYGGAPLPSPGRPFRFDAPVELHKVTVNTVPLILATGGRPVTIHADSRYQVGEIVGNTNAFAAVDGGFFSLEYLDSNVMVGPVLSQSTGQFVPGNVKEIPRITGRPLVLISPEQIKYVPFDPQKHNTLEGIQAELPNLTDAFVGAAWLVRDYQPQPAEAFGNLFDFDAARDRAFWGVDQAGRPVVGVSGDYVDSVALGEALRGAGLKDAVMLDSGASASLVFQGESQMSYEPRPVPHVVALVPPEGLKAKPKCE